MKLVPKYSFEFNRVINDFDEKEAVESYTSLITDRDRFISLLSLVGFIFESISKFGGFEVPNSVEFFVVCSEKCSFKSFSEPITLNYSIFPEVMILFLFKEIIKVYFPVNFFYEVEREEFINAFVKFLFDSSELDEKYLNTFRKFYIVLDEESKKLCGEYSVKKFDFKSKSFVDLVSDYYKKLGNL